MSRFNFCFNLHFKLKIRIYGQKEDGVDSGKILPLLKFFSSKYKWFLSRYFIKNIDILMREEVTIQNNIFFAKYPIFKSIYYAG